MKKRTCLAVLFALVFLGVLGADGSETLNDLLSPVFLSGGPAAVSEHTPYADTINPAASADNQLVTLDLSYLLLTGDRTTEGWGHAVSLGASFPAKFGVISGSGHFFHSPAFSEVNLGTQGSVHVSFAKDLFPNFHIGTGLNAYFGSGWALGMDLGFLHLPGDVGAFKNLAWGAALTNLGYASFTDAATTDYPKMFSLQAGAGATLMKKDPFQIDATVDAFFPGFTNARIHLGGNIIFKEMVNLSFASRIDLAEMLQGDFSALVPSFGIGFTLGLKVQEEKDFLGLEKRGWGNSNLTINTAAAPLQNGLWAFGGGVHLPLGNLDNKPPVISITYEETTYISPNHDGVQDELVVPIDIDDDRYVKEYNFVVKNENDEVVRTIVNKEIRDEDVQFRTIMARLSYVKTGIPIPGEIRWDGFSDGGVVVPDGTYTFQLDATDDNGNKGYSETYTVVVDNTPPALEITVPEAEELIFSPNEDGSKDTLPIQQTGSDEDLWKGEIKTMDGKTVMAWLWENTSPPAFDWNGRDQEGQLLPDSVYQYLIEATDRAGNRTAGKLTNIIINTQETPISIYIDHSFFAPGMEGSRNTMVFTPQVPITTGVEQWKLEIRNTNNQVVKHFTGEKTLPEQITFDGKNDNGSSIQEGRYLGVLEVRYINGNRPRSETPVFTVDKTRPKAEVTVDQPAVFSPDGDGKRDTITIYQDTSTEGTWTGLFTDSKGTTVRRYVWIDRADPVLVWDGYDSLGGVVPDGDYTYTLEAVDRALNRGSSSPVSLRIDTVPTPVALQHELEAFSPNGDSIKEQVVFTPRLEVTGGIQEYRFTITEEGDEIVWTTGGRSRVPETIRWDGFKNDGSKASDGMYRAEIQVVYEKGDTSTARSRLIELDTRYPEAEIAVDLLLFSPDGDGRKDELVFNQTSSNETLWSSEIRSEDGTVIRQLFWKGALEPFTWDGTDEAGNRVKDGVYSYHVAAADKAGNSMKESLEGIVVDTRPTTIFITLDAEGFTPNGDGIQEEIAFNLLVNETSGIARWTLEILDDTGKAVRQFTDSRLPKKIIWNGEREDGSIKDGFYKTRFSVEYNKGNFPVSETQAFILDTSPPRLAVNPAPVPFSPDNDGVDDELTIELKADDASGIRGWEFTILDRERHLFQTFRGEGSPAASIIWDGKGKDGDLVLSAEDYLYMFQVVDNFGLKSEVRGVIPVDVLVVREGNRLKIQIANITFAPNSPELDVRDQTIVDKNIYVIERISQILKKYASYRITIEGHAVNLSWADPVKSEREEREELLELSKLRAQTVKDRLVALGVEEGRISVIGMGGTKPIVPHGDLDNRWKNRRVEFILEK
ncbi:MAG: OmpA family protein [Spirochaetales bacterium]|nr:OmpA family protein [Spirochaetales bacterium]